MLSSVSIVAVSISSVTANVVIGMAIIILAIVLSYKTYSKDSGGKLPLVDKLFTSRTRLSPIPEPTTEDAIEPIAIVAESPVIQSIERNELVVEKTAAILKSHHPSDVQKSAVDNSITPGYPDVPAFLFHEPTRRIPTAHRMNRPMDI